MGWIALALLLLVGVPLAMLFFGVALALWLVWLVAALVWGLLTWLIGDPVVAVVVALVIGIAIGRSSAGKDGAREVRR